MGEVHDPPPNTGTCPQQVHVPNKNTLQVGHVKTENNRTPKKKEDK